MKRRNRFFCALLCLSLCLFFPGCGDKQAAPPSSAAPAVSSEEQTSGSLPVAVDYRKSVAERGLFKSTSDFREWVMDYLAYTYPDEAAVRASRISGGCVPSLPDEPGIDTEVWEVWLSGRAEPLEVTLVMVRENETYFLVGAFDGTNDPLNASDTRDIYRYVREDERFFAKISELPQNALPEGMKSLNLSLLLPEYSDMTCIPVGLSNSKVALLYYRQGEGEDSSLKRLLAVLFDLETGKKQWEYDLEPKSQTQIGDYTFSAEEGKLRVCRVINGTELVRYIGVDGMSTGENKRPAGRVYSDDGKHYGYRNMETNDLWLVDVDTGKETRLLEGTAGETLDSKSGSIVGIAQGKAVYAIYGYEWPIGYGVYDIATGRHTVRENKESVHSLAGGRIHLVTGMGLSSYRYVELSDPALTEKEIPGISGLFAEMKNAEFMLYPIAGKNQLLLSAAVYNSDGGYAPENRLWFFDMSSGELLRTEEAWIYDTFLQGVSGIAGDTLFFHSQRTYSMGQLLFYMQI